MHPSERGAEGEELSIDLAQTGDERAPGLLLLTSGTHGVEGFCGSGCQVALLHDEAFLAAVAQSRVSVLMLHALNPYGFSHLRRANEDNVDLNRNFVDFSAPLPANRGIRARSIRCCCRPRGRRRRTTRRSSARIARDGVQAFQAAVTGGQYAFADGMFYGGRRADLEQRVPARRAARAGGGVHAPGLDRFAHRARTARSRRKDLGRPRRCRRPSRGPGTGGAPRSHRPSRASAAAARVTGRDRQRRA